MSFFKRLKDKFATNKENEEVKSLREEQGQDKLEDTHSEGSTQDVNDLAENAEVKKKPRKLSEADFDDDGLISIEDFEEIEAQKMGAKFKAGLEKSRQNFPSSILNTISLNRSSACICAIYCSVSSFVPDNVPLIPSVETRILPFKWCALQNAK